MCPLFTVSLTKTRCVADRRLKVEAAVASDGGRVSSNEAQCADETYLSSAEWLKLHGLTAHRLGFYDVLAGVAFRHEDGVLDLKVAPHCGDDDAVTEYIVY